MNYGRIQARQVCHQPVYRIVWCMSIGLSIKTLKNSVPTLRFSSTFPHLPSIILPLYLFSLHFPSLVSRFPLDTSHFLFFSFPFSHLSFSILPVPFRHLPFSILPVSLKSPPIFLFFSFPSNFLFFPFPFSHLPFSILSVSL
jgi:hypothetical protein